MAFSHFLCIAGNYIAENFTGSLFSDPNHLPSFIQIDPVYEEIHAKCLSTSLQYRQSRRKSIHASDKASSDPNFARTETPFSISDHDVFVCCFRRLRLPRPIFYPSLQSILYRLHFRPVEALLIVRFRLPSSVFEAPASGIAC